jgi:periplasmic protein TonB
MSYSPYSWRARGTSLLITTAIYVAIGVALFAGLAVAVPDIADREGERGQPLVLRLSPLPRGGPPPRGEMPRKAAESAARKVSSPSEPRSGPDPGEAPQSGTPSRGDGQSDGRGAVGVTPEEQGAPPAIPTGAEVQAFRAILLRHIERFQTYPPASRDAGEQGQVRVRFVMDHEGRVTEAWVETSSGFRALDAESLAVIYRAQPLPTPPAHWPQSFEVMLPIAFSLR